MLALLVAAPAAQASYWPANDGLLTASMNWSRSAWWSWGSQVTPDHTGRWVCPGVTWPSGLYFADDLGVNSTGADVLGLSGQNSCWTKFSSQWWTRMRSDLAVGGTTKRNALYKICALTSHESGHLNGVNLGHNPPNGAMPMTTDFYPRAIGWDWCDGFVSQQGSTPI